MLPASGAILLRFKKELGQHVMVSRKWLRVIADLLEISSMDSVIELGAGTGNLSEELLRRDPGKLTLVEKDPEMVTVLKEKFHSDSRVEVIQGDIRQFLPLRGYDKVASNPPYYLSSELVLGLMRSDFRRAVMTFQREFAERLIAKPGTPEYGSLSVLCSLLLEVRKVAIVGRRAFFPPPKVESMIVVIEPRKGLPEESVDELLKFTKLIFSRRKRLVWRSLKPLLGEEARNVPYADVRPYHLSPEQVLEVIEWLKSKS